MIIGSGLLAKGFKKKHKKSIIFAAGVSNSKETRSEEFLREKNLILKTLLEQQKNGFPFIYFSSIMSDLIDNDYYKHNLKMEELIRNNSNNYLIFRLPQVIGNGGNNENLINNFVKAIKNGEKVKLINRATRSIIDVDDVVRIVNFCKNKIKRKDFYGETINVSEIERISIDDLYLTLTKILNCNPNMGLDITEHNNWETKNSEIVNDAISYLKIEPYRYTINTLKKYIK